MSKKFLGIFESENVSFRNARKQSEVAKELAEERGISPEEVGVPVSVTPESVIKYFEEKAESSNEQEKKIYLQSAKWIEELFEARRELKILREK